jgi:hypothetical protein
MISMKALWFFGRFILRWTPSSVSIAQLAALLGSLPNLDASSIPSVWTL